MSKAIFVLGATGKQGGSVLRALLSHPQFSSDKFVIYAATRNPTTPSAQRLASLSPCIKPVLGNLNDIPAAIAALPSKPWALFQISYPGKNEDTDAIKAIDAAVAAGVSHIVFSSVDRGAGNPATNVPHFITKFNIEKHLKQVSADSKGKLTYTIIRPPFFLDNLEPGFIGKVMATLWKTRVTQPLTVIDTTNIGQFGAAAILEAETPAYRNTAIDVAGDKLTFEAANKIFKEKTGTDLPTTYGFMVSLLFLMVPDIKHMTNFFNDPGFGASVQESNKRFHMADFSEWVDSSKHKKIA